MNKTMIPKKVCLLLLVCLATAAMTSCAGKGSDLSRLFLFGSSRPYFTGVITGTVKYEFSDAPLEGVTVRADVRGETYTAVTGSDGTFTLETGKVRKKDGFNVNFTRENYDELTRAVVFQVKNESIDLGTLYMTDTITGGLTSRSIAGQVLDNHGSIGLAGATVSIANSHYETLVAVTDANGNFEVTGHYFIPGSSYIVTLTKTAYVTDSSVTVSITGAANTIDGNPVRLLRECGSITGTVEDDNTEVLLVGAAVSAVDGLGNTIAAVTDGSGSFSLQGGEFYVGFTYNVSVTRSGYFDGSPTAIITSTGGNTIGGGALHLMINGSISGVVRDPGGSPIAGATVSAEDAGHSVLATGTTAANGTYSLSSASFRKNTAYALGFSHTLYESNSATSPSLHEGSNDAGAVTMQPKSFSGYTLTGVTADDWDTTKKLAASISIVDQDGVTRTATANGSGVFSVTGKFLGGTAYTLNASCTGYTGDLYVDRRIVTVYVNGSSPQSLGQITLFPIGIRAKISGLKKEFSNTIKQTQERFLTGKTGFTLSARDGSNLNTASTFYVHMDDPGQPLPPGGVPSSTVAINGARTGGYLSSGIASDIRTGTIGMTQSAYYYFYVSNPGIFTIETFGTTDTYLYLYDGSGALMAQNDNGGSGGNAKITPVLSAGWYFVRVRGYSDSIYGAYELGVTGPQQDSGLTGTWTINDIIISWYDCGTSTIYIAGYNEVNSSGSITVTMMQGIGTIARGGFSGTLRAVTQTGATVPVTDGYFNVIRSE
jgi:hypothetical protein